MRNWASQDADSFLLMAEPDPGWASTGLSQAHPQTRQSKAWRKVETITAQLKREMQQGWNGQKLGEGKEEILSPKQICNDAFTKLQVNKYQFNLSSSLRVCVWGVHYWHILGNTFWTHSAGNAEAKNITAWSGWMCSQCEHTHKQRPLEEGIGAFHDLGCVL